MDRNLLMWTESNGAGKKSVLRSNWYHSNRFSHQTLLRAIEARGLGYIQNRLCVAAELLDDTELHDAMKEFDKFFAHGAGKGIGLSECIWVCSANKMSPQNFPVLEQLAKSTPNWKHGSLTEARRSLENACQHLYSYIMDSSPDHTQTLPEVVKKHPILDIVSPIYWDTVQAKRWADGWPEKASDSRLGHRLVGWGLTLDMFDREVIGRIVGFPEFRAASMFVEETSKLTGDPPWCKGKYDLAAVSKRYPTPDPEPTPPPEAPTNEEPTPEDEDHPMTAVSPPAQGPKLPRGSKEDKKNSKGKGAGQTKTSKDPASSEALGGTDVGSEQVVKAPPKQDSKQPKA
ncbi:hypothetical protein FRC07_014043, partial [Ceratobasidium sp. 392]